MVILAPVPAMAPGFTIQFPAGRPLNVTFPVATKQSVWLIVPINGAAGVVGFVLISTFDDTVEIHPDELVTVKAEVPGERPVMLILLPLPVLAPGFIVQVPVGNPLNITLPVAEKQSGWVITPVIGADGVAGWLFITIPADANEVHPTEFVTE